MVEFCVNLLSWNFAELTYSLSWVFSFGRFLEISYIANHVILKRNNYISFCQYYLPFISFSCLTLVSTTVLNCRYDKNYVLKFGCKAKRLGYDCHWKKEFVMLIDPKRRGSYYAMDGVTWVSTKVLVGRKMGVRALAVVTAGRNR